MLETLKSLENLTEQELASHAEESIGQLEQLSSKEVDRLNTLCHLSFVGQLIGFNTTKQSTYWAPVDKIAGVESTEFTRVYKLFIEGKNSPVMCYIDTFELSSAIKAAKQYEKD